MPSHTCTPTRGHSHNETTHTHTHTQTLTHTHTNTLTHTHKHKHVQMMNVYYFHHQADELLGTASEQFLGKSVKEIKQTILQTLEGHLRAILGE